MQDKSDPVLEQFVSNAFRRFDANLEAALPRSAPNLRQHLQARADEDPNMSSRRATFRTSCCRIGSARLGNGRRTLEFQTDVIYSSINGYYSIRLCDNIADNDSPPELRKLAPCTLYFDSEAIAPYRKYFPATHEFWNLFDTVFGAAGGSVGGGQFAR